MSKKSTIIILLFLFILLFSSFVDADWCVSTSGVLVVNSTAWDDTNLTNVSLYGTWGGGWHLNETNHSGINNTDYLFTINYTGFADGIYYYKFRAEDWCKNWKYSSISDFRMDGTPPIVNLVTPTTTSTWSNSNIVTFTYNVGEEVATYCNLIINNVTVQTDTSIATYTTQTFTQTLSNGDYDWSINCVDVCYLENTSETRTLTVNYVDACGSSSGVGGGGGASGTSEIRFTGLIKAWLIKTITFARDLGVMSIDVITKYDVSDAITIQDITRSPNVPSLPISPKEGTIYKYLLISAPKITTVLEKAVINFKVDKEWFTKNNFDKNNIELKRLDNTIWETLPTEKTKSDQNFFYYSSETASFSKFAIIVKNEAAVEKEIRTYIQPDSLFYSLKLGFENVKLFLLPGKVWKAEYCLKLADKRADELQRMVKENKLKYINQLESEWRKRINKAYSYSSKIDNLADEKYILEEIEKKTEEHLIVLESIRSKTHQKKGIIDNIKIKVELIKMNVMKKIKEVDLKIRYTAEVIKKIK